MSTRFCLWMSALLISGAAGAAQPPSALKECHDSSANRTEVGQCLDRKFAEANAELSDTVKAVREQMKKLDEVTGRPLATRAFDRSQKAFGGFREGNCAWVAAQLSAGTGSGDVARDCMIRMTRARTEELRGQGKGPGSAVRPEPPSQSGGPAGLVGRAWRLTRLVHNGREVGLVPESTPSIQFDQAGHVTGNASINRFSGGYAVDASGALRWSQPGFVTTRMAGPAEVMQQEGWFLDALDRAAHLRVEGDILVMDNDEQTIVLTFGH